MQSPCSHYIDQPIHKGYSVSAHGHSAEGGQGYEHKQQRVYEKLKEKGILPVCERSEDDDRQ